MLRVAASVPSAPGTLACRFSCGVTVDTCGTCGREGTPVTQNGWRKEVCWTALTWR